MAEWTYKDGWYVLYDLIHRRKICRAKWTAERARQNNEDRKRNGLSARWVYSKRQKPRRRIDNRQYVN